MSIYSVHILIISKKHVATCSRLVLKEVFAFRFLLRVKHAFDVMIDCDNLHDWMSTEAPSEHQNVSSHTQSSCSLWRIRALNYSFRLESEAIFLISKKAHWLSGWQLRNIADFINFNSNVPYTHMIRWCITHDKSEYMYCTLFHMCTVQINDTIWTRLADSSMAWQTAIQLAEWFKTIAKFNTLRNIE